LIACLDPDAVAWGRFDVRIEGQSHWFPIISTLINWRSRWTGVATGDQGLFMTRRAYAAVGGFPPLPLMEDVAITKALRRRAPPICLAAPISTSGRRWEKHGVLRTVWLMWQLRFDFWRGVAASELHARYYGSGRP
jgi:hypothetical protein